MAWRPWAAPPLPRTGAGCPGNEVQPGNGKRSSTDSSERQRRTQITRSLLLTSFQVRACCGHCIHIACNLPLCSVSSASLLEHKK